MREVNCRSETETRFVKGTLMLIRIQDCIINTDSIAHAQYNRRALAPAGLAPQGIPAGTSLTIHFIGGSEKGFRGNEADSLWAHLSHEIQVVLPNPPQ